MSKAIGNYICKNGRRAVFYDCDPSKNKTCKKTICGLLMRGSNKFGCVVTTNKAASREGAKPFFLWTGKSGPVILVAREYIEEARENE